MLPSAVLKNQASVFDHPGDKTAICTMRISILTFDGFNELDSLIAFNMLKRVRKPDWRVGICCEPEFVTSMNGLVLKRQETWSEAATADVVLVGSGTKTRELVAAPHLMAALRLDPQRQLIGAQCSGALVLAKLQLLEDIPACTDTTTKPWVQEAGIQVLDQPFFARNNIATAGGCLATQYLAAWVLYRSAGREAAIDALAAIAPVSEKHAYIERALQHIEMYCPPQSC